MSQHLDLLAAQFRMLDLLRGMQGDLMGAVGLGPNECPYRLAGSGPFWRLRDYSPGAASPPLLVVSAPIKRPYIWDLTPAVSAIHHCLEQGFHVHLLEWAPAFRENATGGLEEHAHAIAECAARISSTGSHQTPVLVGHSLGGTLAAICAALAPDCVRALVLLSAPLCFQPGVSRFRDALVALVPPDLSTIDPFPGSLLSQVSAAAAPDTFLWSRQADFAASLHDPKAADIHARVERWALDEVPLSGKFVHQVLDWLYRSDRFCAGTLEIEGNRLGPAQVPVPTFVAVNGEDDVAPLGSVTPFTSAMPSEVRIVSYPGEIGVCLQHVGLLVGRVARATVWPELMAWCHARF